jgi:hypothetical protein
MPLILNEEDEEAAHQRSLLINYNNEQRGGGGSRNNGNWSRSDSEQSDGDEDDLKYYVSDAITRSCIHISIF